MIVLVQFCGMQSNKVDIIHMVGNTGFHRSVEVKTQKVNYIIFNCNTNFIISSVYHCMYECVHVTNIINTYRILSIHTSL